MTSQVGGVGSERPAVGGPAPAWWDGWNPAYSEASLFVGGCVAAGAVLGALTELVRPAWGRRHAARGHPARTRPSRPRRGRTGVPR